MNDLPAKRKRKLGVAPTKPQFVPGCTHFAPKCTQCKTKGLLQNESLKLYHYLSHFTKTGTRGMMRAPFFLSYILSFIFGLPFGGKACRPRTLPSPAHTLRA